MSMTAERRFFYAFTKANGSRMAAEWQRSFLSQRKTRQLAGGFRLCSTAIFDCVLPLSWMATTDITDYA
ncbi:TPA: hypothetical protein ACSTL1_002504 [Serratia fonticola]